MRLSPEQLSEIEAQRAQPLSTRRVVTRGMEERLYTAHSVPHHEFVRVTDYMDDNAAIRQAARVPEILKADSTRCYDNYQAMIGRDGQPGLARMDLPANVYTQWYWNVLGVAGFPDLERGLLRSISYEKMGGFFPIIELRDLLKRGWLGQLGSV